MAVPDLEMGVVPGEIIEPVVSGGDDPAPALHHEPGRHESALVVDLRDHLPLASDREPGMASDVVSEHEGPVVADLHVERDVRLGQIDLHALVLVGKEYRGSRLPADIHARVSLRAFPARPHCEALPLGEAGKGVLGGLGADVLHAGGGALLRHGDGPYAEHPPQRGDGSIRVLGLHVEAGAVLVDQRLDPVVHQHREHVLPEKILELLAHGSALQTYLGISNKKDRHMSSNIEPRYKDNLKEPAGTDTDID